MIFFLIDVMFCESLAVVYHLPPPHPTLLFCLLLVCPLVKWGGGGGPPPAPHSHLNRQTQHCQSEVLGNFPEFSGKTCHKSVIFPPCLSCPLTICGSGVFSGFAPSLYPLPLPVLHSPRSPPVMPAWCIQLYSSLVLVRLDRANLAWGLYVTTREPVDSGVWSQESGVRSQESGVRSQDRS